MSLKYLAKIFSRHLWYKNYRRRGRGNANVNDNINIWNRDKEKVGKKQGIVTINKATNERSKAWHRSK